jgi:VIT1/CCC1 family predicted Fe2+/Mn2+ transporter/rubrerythrin
MISRGSAREDSRTQALVEALTRNWQAEMEGAATYRALGERETDPTRQAVLFKLADAEVRHAERWAQRLRELGAPVPTYTGSPTGEADSLANRVGGPEASLRRVELGERKHVAEYGRQLEELADEPSARILREVIADERSHSQTLKSMLAPTSPRDARTRLDKLLKRERHRTGGTWIGDAIYGVNDGLGAIFGIVSGVSGATLGNSHYVLLAGIAGMVASSLSMGSGAYLAAKSERELYEAELHRERAEIDENPEEEREELALFYQLKGVPEDEAIKLADHVAQDPDEFLRSMAAEELNLTEEALSNPLVSAVSGSLSTAVGAFIPIIPFFFLTGYAAVVAAAIISLLAHFAVGAAKSLITVRSWWSSGLEMTVVGAVEGAITYAVGVGLGRLGA